MIHFQGGNSSLTPRQKLTQAVRFSPNVEYIPHLESEDQFTRIEDINLQDLTLQNSDSDGDSSYDEDPPPELIYEKPDKERQNLFKRALKTIASHPAPDAPFNQITKENDIPAPILQAAVQNLVANIALDSSQRRYQEKVDAFHAAQKYLPRKERENYSPLRTISNDYIITSDPETGRSIKIFKFWKNQTP